MHTQVFFYAFSTQEKPGKLVCHGIRFETLELDGSLEANQAQLKILCETHEELKGIDLKAFKSAVAANFPSH